MEIIQNLFKELCLLIQHILASFLAVACDCYLGGFLTPDMDSFAKLFGANTADGLASVMNVFRIIGISIVILLIGYVCFLHFFGNAIEIRETITSLPKRATIAVIACMIMGTFAIGIVDVADEAHTNIINLFTKAIDSNYKGWEGQDHITGTENDKQYYEGLLAILPETFAPGSTEKPLTGIFGEVSTDTLASMIGNNPALQIGPFILNVLLHCILYVVLGYNLVKLYAEYIKRYAVMGSLYIISPMMSGFIATRESSQIFVSYMKMFFTQIGIFIGTKVWIQFSISAIRGVDADLFGAFLIIGFMSIGVKLEAYARDMGFTVTNQGISLLDSIATTGMMMGRVMGGTVKGIGNGAITAGSAMGSVGAVKLGSVLTGKAIDPASLQKTMASNIGGQARIASGAELTGSQKKLLSNVAKQGFTQNRAMADMIATSNNPTAASQHILDANGGTLNAEMKNRGMSIQANGEVSNIKGLGATVFAKDKNGNMQAVRNGYISDHAQGEQSLAFTDSSGKTAYLNFTDKPLASFNGGDETPLCAEGETLTDALTSGEIITGQNVDRSMLNEPAEPSYADVQGAVGGGENDVVAPGATGPNVVDDGSPSMGDIGDTSIPSMSSDHMEDDIIPMAVGGVSIEDDAPSVAPIDGEATGAEWSSGATVDDAYATAQGGSGSVAGGSGSSVDMGTDNVFNAGPGTETTSAGAADEGSATDDAARTNSGGNYASNDEADIGSKFTLRKMGNGYGVMHSEHGGAELSDGGQTKMVGYTSGSYSYGEPLYADKFAQSFTTDNGAYIKEQFAGNGMFASLGFTPQNIERINDTSYILTGTNPVGEECKISISRALDDVTKDNRNVRNGWRVSAYTPKRKRADGGKKNN